MVATVLTVYGIETQWIELLLGFLYRLVATVLTVYGIETLPVWPSVESLHVATVLTVYGIETVCREEKPDILLPGLQQHLSITVLKP